MLGEDGHSHLNIGVSNLGIFPPWKWNNRACLRQPKQRGQNIVLLAPIVTLLHPLSVDRQHPCCVWWEAAAAETRLPFSPPLFCGRTFLGTQEPLLFWFGGSASWTAGRTRSRDPGPDNEGKSSLCLAVPKGFKIAPAAEGDEVTLTTNCCQRCQHLPSEGGNVPGTRRRSLVLRARLGSRRLGLHPGSGSD